LNLEIDKRLFVKKFIHQDDNQIKNSSISWDGLIFLTCLSAMLLILMEWVFLLTKPSFLDLFSPVKKVGTVLFGMALFASSALIILGIIYILGYLIKGRNSQKLSYKVACFIPVVILVALILMLIDNFTYTLFRFGILNAKGFWRLIYAFSFVSLIILIMPRCFQISNDIQKQFNPRVRKKVYLQMIGIIIFGLLFGLSGFRGDYEYKQIGGDEALIKKPHIIWITSDGVSSEHLSVFGYHRDTTPNLRSLAQSALVADNAFTNSRNTIGSIVSMFSSKDPMQTKVLRTPDILTGDDAYQHLPGILNSYGYYTVQYGYPHHVDASTVNLIGGFDIINGRSTTYNTFPGRFVSLLPNEISYFLSVTFHRIIDRLLHIFFIKDIQNPNDIVVLANTVFYDKPKMEVFLAQISELKEPSFIHLHLLITHGSTFRIENQVFSFGKDPLSQEPWDIDFYDDAILEFDANIGRIIDTLKQNDLLNNTILIVGSDHATQFDQRERIPLLIRFPDGSYAGRIATNVQGMDIAPTILDYLGLSKPDWMQGQSLLSTYPTDRLIFGTGLTKKSIWDGEDIFELILPDKIKPPFYQFGIVSVQDCQRNYELDLKNTIFTIQDTKGYVNPCPVTELLSIDQAYNLLINHLNQHGFDTTSLSVLDVRDLIP
jgi:hypothetical protein